MVQVDIHFSDGIEIGIFICYQHPENEGQRARLVSLSHVVVQYLYQCLPEFLTQDTKDKDGVISRCQGMSMRDMALCNRTSGCHPKLELEIALM